MSSPFKLPSSCDECTWEEGRWSRPESLWPEGHSKPRTCSFCGSVHPADLIGLLRAGWELERTSKGYKSYAHPPGYRAHMDAMFSKVDENLLHDNVPFLEPTPPAKFYHNHLTDEQAAEINTILLLRNVSKVN